LAVAKSRAGEQNTGVLLLQFLLCPLLLSGAAKVLGGFSFAFPRWRSWCWFVGPGRKFPATGFAPF